MAQFLAHEKLEVYGVALRFAKLADAMLREWPSSWAVHGQLDRASESVVTNLVKAARWRATENGIYSIECSLGSVLECAACLDVACRRKLLGMPQVCSAKEVLRDIAGMEVGLRRSWCNSVREEPGLYSVDTGGYFAHESLDVYRRSLELHGSLAELLVNSEKRTRYEKRVDELSTSLTVNIAEGNGRFSNVDHSKFLRIAEDAGTKLAAYLDLAEAILSAEMNGAKAYLREVMAMLAGLRGYLEE